ncbi:MAG: sensor histidine kinase [Betaproteobacteria bacterium]
MLSRLPINLKVFVAPLVVLLLFVTVSAVSIVVLRDQGAAFREVVGGAFDAATTTSRLTITVAGIHSDVLRHLDVMRLEQDPESLKSLRESMGQRFDQAEAMLQSLEANSYSLDPELLHNVSEFMTIYRIVATKITQSATLNPTLVSTLIAHHQQLEEYLEELANVTIKSAKDKQQQTAAAVRRAMGLLGLATLVGVIVAIVATWFIGRAISVPLSKMTSVMSRLAAGDHEIRIPAIDSRDEVGSMARAVEVFRQHSIKLHRREAELAQMVDRLAILRDQADEASRAKSAFLANMSHELRTPLNALIGYSEMLYDGLYGKLPDRAREPIGRVQANAKHLLGLINNVLDLSKIEAGQFTLHPSEYSMSGVVEAVVSATESLSQAKKLAVTVDVPQSLPHGYGDEQRLSQVLLNLVGNAIKFTDAGGIHIRATAADGAFDVSVRDTGPGIPAEHQKSVFEEFQQVDASTTRKKGGSGLGLSIAKRIVELHGGRMYLKSEVGEGSTFGFVLPIRCGEERAQEADHAHTGG